MDKPTTEHSAITRQIMLNIGNVRSILRVQMDEVARPFNLTGRQMSILLALYDDVGISAADVSRLLYLDAGMLTRVLDHLDDKNLISRARCTIDRRMVELSLTELGRNVAATLSHKSTEILNARFRNFDELELQTLHSLLAKFLGSRHNILDNVKG